MFQPQDFGPIYKETLSAGIFPVEPYNTLSNIIFLLVLFVIGRLIKGNANRHQLLVFALPILGLGFVGGTLFHATRSHRFWLVMDFLPILILSVSASIYFWLKIIRSRILAALIAVLVIAGLRYLLSSVDLPMQLRISLGYASLGAAIIVPLLIHCARASFANAQYVLCTLASFGLALYCRVIDSSSSLPMGTHFLWHIFGGISTFSLMYYIYLDDLAQAGSGLRLSKSESA